MITRDNYEEFFLLYMDNELPVADRKLVERFVAENPDLEEEWDALLQCRIKPDQGEQPVFGHKELLMKSEGAARVGDTGRFGDAARIGDAAGIGDEARPDDSNYEDYFLSYIDGELNEREAVAVEAYVRQHPSKGLELERLRQTISRPDAAIIFPDKESLYRKEDGGRLLVSPWWRVAAAAAVLGAVGLLFFYHPTKEGQPIANGKGGLQPAAIPAGPASPALAEAGLKKEGDKKESSAVTPARATALYSSGSRKKDKGPDERGSVEPEKMAVVEKVSRRDLMNERASEDRTAIGGASDGRRGGERNTDERKSEIARVSVENIAQQEGRAVAAVDPGVLPGHGKTVDAIDRAVGSQETVIPKEKSSFATQALLNNSTASRDDEEDTFGAEPVSAKKNKFRGIFRKVSRAFEKTAGREDDGQRKVLIGAFQIALK